MTKTFQCDIQSAVSKKSVSNGLQARNFERERSFSSLLHQLDFFKTDKDIASNHISLDGGLFPLLVDSIWRIFMLFVRENGSLFCGRLRIDIRKCLQQKVKICSSHFVMQLADMLLLGRFYPLCTQSSNAKWCISRNEMSTDNLNDLFLFSKEKVFMAYSISMVTGCTSQLTLWNKMKHLNLTLKVTFKMNWYLDHMYFPEWC